MRTKPEKGGEKREIQNPVDLFLAFDFAAFTGSYPLLPAFPLML